MGNVTKAVFSTYLVQALFFFQAEDGIRDADVTGVQTCALPISMSDSVRKACPKPTGTSSWRRLSALSSAAHQRPKVGDPARRSTATSRIRPSVQRTSFAIGADMSW